ncbi:MAG TPA: hypothetical protein VD813_08080 [Pseudonocardia sp.]|nr:hypothetical protein [Pseudonocardia sp.]
MTRDVVNAYTLLVGDEDGPPTVSVHASADDAWKALDREVRARCRMRPRPRRTPDPEATRRLADAWRAGYPERRFWQLLSHQLPVLVPATARRVVVARH